MSDALHGAPAGSGRHGGAGHVAHHFSSAGQQYSASKLGMWLFLATELLMFGGLFVAYATYRANHPEIFQWASVLLDTRMGATNTLILITSSLTMALAVQAAQRDQRIRLVTFLSLTFLGACGFLGIKYLEYRPKIENGLLWGRHFEPDEAYVAHHQGVEPSSSHGAPEAPKAVDLARGEKVATQTCASCHGKDLRGLPNNGVDLTTSEFVGSKSDAELVDFLKVGRTPWDPDSRTKIQMPPRGGNPTIDDDMLRDVVAYLRTRWIAPGTAPAAAGLAVAADTAVAEATLEIPVSVIPPAAEPPPGLAVAAAAVSAGAMEMPRNAQHFFGVYFLMTGLHAIHVLAGMVVILTLIAGALRGRYGSAYFTPVDLGGLFWHLVDLIWIFLFPLFYLI